MIYVCGAQETIEFLPPFLEKRLKIPISPWDATTHIQIEEGVPRPLLPLATSAIGLAIKALDKANGGFNFHQGAFASKKGFDIIKKPLAIALTLLFLLFLLTAIHFYLGTKEKSQEYDELIRQAEQIYARVNPQGSLATGKQWEKIYEVREFLKQRLDESLETTPPIADAMPRWATIAKAITEARKQYYFTIEYLAIGPKEAILEGRTESDLCFDFLKAYLKQIPDIAQEDDSLRLVHSQLIEHPKNPKLPRHYKFWIKFKE